MQSRPRISIGLLIATFLCALLLCKTASAQTSADFSAGGSVRLGWDSRACEGTIAGNIRYNSSTACAEFCDGTDWTCPDSSSGGCTAPSDCSEVGDVCDDDSIFAGFVLYDGDSCEALYVTDDNQSTSSQWKTANGTNDITDPADPADKVDTVDGKYNRDNRGSGTFPAFELCEDNTYHGKNDWYLPARAELNLLYLNQAAIDANAAGIFTEALYWSSTEAGSSYAFYQFLRLDQGEQRYSAKTTGYDVRCVRRD